MPMRALFVTLVAALPPALAVAQNVALNKPVTIVAGAGNLIAPTPSFAVVTDGVFLGEATSYSSPAADTGSIRWVTSLGGVTTIEVQLGGDHTIDGIIVQADDNDALFVTYLGPGGTFLPLYTVPYVSVGFGFRTRPSGDQSTWVPLAPVSTTTIRVTNAGGDGYYGISELHLRGVVVSPPCDPDINCDGNTDQDDIVCLIDAVAGSPGCECQDQDFNQDGNTNQDDVVALITMIAGGGCP